MKLNYTLNICYIFCLALALSLNPLKSKPTPEVVKKQDKVKIEKAKKAPESQDVDILHGDFLFR